MAENPDAEAKPLAGRRQQAKMLSPREPN